MTNIHDLPPLSHESAQLKLARQAHGRAHRLYTLIIFEMGYKRARLELGAESPTDAGVMEAFAATVPETLEGI